MVHKQEYTESRHRSVPVVNHPICGFEMVHQQCTDRPCDPVWFSVHCTVCITTRESNFVSYWTFYKLWTHQGLKQLVSYWTFYKILTHHGLKQFFLFWLSWKGHQLFSKPGGQSFSFNIFITYWNMFITLCMYMFSFVDSVPLNSDHLDFFNILSCFKIIRNWIFARAPHCLLKV